MMLRMSQEFGEGIEVAGPFFNAFPLPHTLLSLKRYSGLNETKIMRLHAVAKSALEGLLDRHSLRSMNIDEALTKLQELPGIGPFFAQGILHRGAGLVDAITLDDVSRYAVQNAYNLAQLPDRETMPKISEPGQPFRMWALVLLHISARREVGLPSLRY
jgi:DNA-3-methyladenine glycosylase II